MANDAYSHTMNLHNVISPQEATTICRLYGKTLSSFVEIKKVNVAGINEITLIERNYTDKKTKLPSTNYDIEVVINVGRLLRKSKILMVALNKKTVEKIISRLTNIFANKFLLGVNHSDAGEWNISRLDCGIDLKMFTDDPLVLREYIRILHDSFNYANSKNVTYLPYKTTKSFEEIKYESISLICGNGRYVYNIYYKLQELKNKGVVLSEKEIAEVANVIRIEKQILDVGKVFGCSNKLSSLLDENLTERLMAGVVRDMKELFGRGDYMNCGDGTSKILSSKLPHDRRIELAFLYGHLDTIPYAYHYRVSEGIIEYLSDTEQDFKERKVALQLERKQLEDIGVSVALVHSADNFPNINTLIDNQCYQTKKPRRKGSFGEIRLQDEGEDKYRYKCNASLHLHDGTTKRFSIASSIGGDIAEIEEKIIKKVISLAKINLDSVGDCVQKQIACIEYAQQDLENFLSVATENKSKEFISKANGVFDNMKHQIQPEAYAPQIPEELHQLAQIRAE